MKLFKPFFAIIMISAILVSFKLKPVAETYQVSTDQSDVKWTGYHVAKSYEHWGNIKVKSGIIVMEGDELTGGEFVIDMTSISCGDIEDSEKNGKLVGHLKNEDFFNVEKYGESKLVIKSATKNGDTYNVTADITIRGISNEITFDATKSASGDQVEFNAIMKVDRTVHKVMYGWSVENVVLSNEFKLDVKLVAKK